MLTIEIKGLSNIDLQRQLHHLFDPLSLSDVSSQDLGDSLLRVSFTLHPQSTPDHIHAVLKDLHLTYSLTSAPSTDHLPLEGLRTYLKDRRAALLQSKQLKND
jgi:hypothetical protein